MKTVQLVQKSDPEKLKAINFKGYFDSFSGTILTSASEMERAKAAGAIWYEQAAQGWKTNRTATNKPRNT